MTRYLPRHFRLSITISGETLVMLFDEAGTAKQTIWNTWCNAPIKPEIERLAMADNTIAYDIRLADKSIGTILEVQAEVIHTQPEHL